MNAAIRTTKISGTTCEREFRVLDLVHLSRMTMGDRSLETEVLGLFLRQSATLAERAVKAEATELPALAHTLKGSAKAVGAWRVAGCAERLEACVGTSSGDVPSALAELRQAVQEVHAAIAGISQPA